MTDGRDSFKQDHSQVPVCGYCCWASFFMGIWLSVCIALIAVAL